MRKSPGWPSVHTCLHPPGLPFHPHPSRLSRSSRGTELNCLRYRAASYCTWGGEYTSVPTSQLTPPSPPLPPGCKPTVNKPKLCGFTAHGSLEDVTSAMQVSGHKRKTFHSLRPALLHEVTGTLLGDLKTTAQVSILCVLWKWEPQRFQTPRGPAGTSGLSAEIWILCLPAPPSNHTPSALLGARIPSTGLQ